MNNQNTVDVVDACRTLFKFNMSKREKKIFDIAKMARTARNRTRRFIDQKILAGSKALLLIGGDTNPNFREKFVQKCKSSWKIAGLSHSRFECDQHIPLQKLSTPSVAETQEKLRSFHKLYESIVMLPERADFYKGVTEAGFMEQFYPEHEPNKAQLALLTFRMASRFLTSSGVVILSSSEASFFQQKGLPTALQILNDQLSCINVHLGQRDHTDIDSHSLSVLCQEMNLDEPGKEQEAVLELYKNWVEGRGLPFPGSFAKLLRKDDVIYPEFY